MIILCGAEKGGVGKTTIATNLAAGLAARGGDVLLLDCDNQRNAAEWAEQRAADQPDAPAIRWSQLTGDNILPAILDQAKRYEHVVIDAGGRDSAELRAACIACDVLVSPIAPSVHDLRTIPRMQEIVRLARGLRPDGGPVALFFLNQVSTHHMDHDQDEASEIVAEAEGFEVLKARAGSRKAYKSAAMDGLAAIEGGAGKARDEMQQLLEEVLSYGT